MHTSVPANPLIAEPPYLAGYIERKGTGTTDMVQKSIKAGLAEPQFVQAEDFRSVIYRPGSKQVREQVRKIVLCLELEMTVTEIMAALELKGRRNFLQNYLQPALDDGMVEMTQPNAPNSPTQKYRLTTSGKMLKEQLS